MKTLTISTDINGFGSYISSGPDLNLNLNVTIGTIAWVLGVLSTEEEDSHGRRPFYLVLSFC